MLTITSHSEQEMRHIGEKIGRHLKAGSVLILTGELGTGKTTLTKGIAKGLDIQQMIKSPTYTIVCEYEGRLPLYHMDVYRIDGDTDGVELEEYIRDDSVVIIEWGELIDDPIINHPIRITLDRLPDDNRQIVIDFGKNTDMEKNWDKF